MMGVLLLLCVAGNGNILILKIKDQEVIARLICFADAQKHRHITMGMARYWHEGEMI